MGITDKIIRFAIAAVLGGVYFSGYVTGTWGLVALIGAGIMLLTSLISSCPLYSVFGINTRGKAKLS